MSSIYRVKLRGPHHPHIFPVLNTRYIFWYILSRLPASDSLSIFNAVLPQREAFVWSGAGDSVITLQMDGEDVAQLSFSNQRPQCHILTVHFQGPVFSI